MIIRGMRSLFPMVGIGVFILSLCPSALAMSETADNGGQKSEVEKDLLIPDLLDSPPEPEDRLVILPEIKREGERFFLSSFKLPDKITFAGVPVPLDNWQVRER